MTTTETNEYKELNEKISAKVDEDTKAKMKQFQEELKAQDIVKNALKEGAEIPAFELANSKGEVIKIAELLKQGPVVINFFRGGWCPYCSLELKKLQDNYQEFKNLGAEIVAISPEREDTTKETKNTNNIQFKVLSDKGATVAKQFGLVFRLSDTVEQIYREKFNIHLEEHNIKENPTEMPVPATYIISQDLKIFKSFIDIDYTKRPEPQDILDELKKISK